MAHNLCKGFGVIALFAATTCFHAVAQDAEKPAEPDKAKQLIAALKDPAAAKRKEAVLAVARMGIAGRVAEPALVELLRDKDVGVRLLAAYALERLETGK